MYLLHSQCNSYLETYIPSVNGVLPVYIHKGFPEYSYRAYGCPPEFQTIQHHHFFYFLLIGYYNPQSIWLDKNGSIPKIRHHLLAGVSARFTRIQYTSDVATTLVSMLVQLG
jgi:hypothetical protein